MAGTNFEVLSPGYSTLYTRDFPYALGGGEAGLNPISPNDTRPLVEGEWLEYASTAAAGYQWSRGGDNAGDNTDEAVTPSFPFFLESGRYDMQTLGKVHCIIGPTGFEFRTRICDSTGLAVNDAVSVWDITMSGIIRRGLQAASAIGTESYVIGHVTRVFGTNDIGVWFNPYHRLDT